MIRITERIVRVLILIVKIMLNVMVMETTVHDGNKNI